VAGKQIAADQHPGASTPPCLAAWPTHIGIEYVYQLCAYLPLMGLITVFLPNIEKRVRA